VNAGGGKRIGIQRSDHRNEISTQCSGLSGVKKNDGKRPINQTPEDKTHKRRKTRRGFLNQPWDRTFGTGVSTAGH